MKKVCHMLKVLNSTVLTSCREEKDEKNFSRRGPIIKRKIVQLSRPDNVVVLPFLDFLLKGTVS
jgi:hypothetical protein